MLKRNNLSNREISEVEHFDKLAEDYDANYTYDTPFTQYKIQKKLNVLFSQYSSRQKLSILEIGAGTGEYTQYIAEMFPNASIVAIDISPKILDMAREKCKKYKNITFEVASAYDLPYKNETFDVVCGFYILHHIDLKITLEEMHRVLKPKSTALFYEPNILNPVVCAIKSIPFLKERAGDSPEEWAINPFTLEKNCTPFSKLKWHTSEFIAIPSRTNFEMAKKLDTFMSKVGKFPVANLLGGSVSLIFEKQ